jgi:hypothetical protein
MTSPDTTGHFHFTLISMELSSLEDKISLFLGFYPQKLVWKFTENDRNSNENGTFASS